MRLSDMLPINEKKDHPNGSTWKQQHIYFAKNKHGVQRRYASNDEASNKKKATAWAANDKIKPQPRQKRPKGPGQSYSIYDNVNMTEAVQIGKWKVENKSRVVSRQVDPTFMQDFILRGPKITLQVTEFFGDWTVRQLSGNGPSHVWNGLNDAKVNQLLKQVGAPMIDDLENLNDDPHRRDLHHQHYGTEHEALDQAVPPIGGTLEAAKTSGKNNYRVDITGFDRKSIKNRLAGKHPSLATISMYVYSVKDEDAAIRQAIEKNKSKIRRVGFMGPAKKLAVNVTRVRQDGGEIGSPKRSYTVTAESLLSRKSNETISLVELLDDKYKNMIGNFTSKDLEELNS